MILHMNLPGAGYDILIERGALNRAGSFLNLKRKVLVVRDSGVPAEYARKILSQSEEGYLYTVPEGEGSKSFQVLEDLLREMLRHSFTRKDCLAAVGGGVTGDLAGFAASCYMRGIDFYNIPTTVLSQVDSSVGGKTAVNLDGVKNAAGAFYQPKAVLIDPDTLKTLPYRQIAAGLAEALKMSVTSDSALFRLFEEEIPEEHLDEIIAGAIRIKMNVVSQDEKEQGLRRVLNFGHTIGHALESAGGMQEFLHGECVALGMIPMCGDRLRPRLLRVLRKMGLPVSVSLAVEEILPYLLHDKKSDGSRIAVILSDEPGSFREVRMTAEEIAERLPLILRERSTE